MVITTSGKSLAFSVSRNATFAFYLQELMFRTVIYSWLIAEAQPRKQLWAFWQYLFIILKTCQTAHADYKPSYIIYLNSLYLYCSYWGSGQCTLHTIISSGRVCKGCLICNEKHCKQYYAARPYHRFNSITVVQLCSWVVRSGHSFVLIQSPRT